MPYKYLNPENLNNYFTNGYLKIPNFLSDGQLQQLRNLFNYLMQEDTTIDKAIYEKEDKVFITNLDNICSKGNLACLALMGQPEILAIAEQICRPDFFLIQEFAVIKNKGDKLPVYWHQNMEHQGNGNGLTIGIYLDDALANDGALKVIPQSHKSTKKICDIIKEPSTEVVMEAKGILIHDMLLAHSSTHIKTNTIRRVIYFIFLSAAHVQKEKIYCNEIINRRTSLTQIAIQFNKEMAAIENNKESNLDNENLIQKTKTSLLKIYSEATKPRPSNYCFEFNTTL